MRFIALKSIAAAALLMIGSNAFAQTPAPAPVPAPAVDAAPDAAPAPAAPAADAAPDAAPAQDPAPAPAEEPSLAKDPDDPGNIIANYFTSMTDIIAANMNTPEVLIEKFTAFIKENEKSMKKASENFDDKMKKLKASEAEVYRETVQRKITPQLNKLITLLIDFANKYPTEAQKLDSMLKIDTKYTYQQ